MNLENLTLIGGVLLTWLSLVLLIGKLIARVMRPVLELAESIRRHTGAITHLTESVEHLSKLTAEHDQQLAEIVAGGVPTPRKKGR